MDVKLDSSKMLTPGEEKKINDAIKELEDMRDGAEINGIQGVNYEVKDRNLIDKKIKELDALRKANSVPRLSPEDRLKAEKERDAIAEDLRRVMVPWDTYVSSTPKAGPRHTKLVTELVRQQLDQVHQQKIRRWKKLARLVDPENPYASDVRLLHPQD